MGAATPAVSSLGCADFVEKGKLLPARNSRSSREALPVELMQPLQRSKSVPLYADKRQGVLICQAGGQAAQYFPSASLAQKSMWYTDRSVTDPPIWSLGMEGVQPELHSRHVHAISNSSLADVGLIPNQHLRNDTAWKSSVNSETRLALMPLLQDLAVAMTAAKQLPVGRYV